MEIRRCDWVKKDIEREYHDKEWGKPLHDDGKLFELLILEGMQAGLSWITILNKRENMRTAFDGFDPVIISGYGDEKMERLMSDPGIIRNRLKLKALVNNAKAFLDIQKEYGTFDEYIWSFTQNKPVINAFTESSQVPAKTELSDYMSKELKKKGFTFVGTTICYSFMQAIGMVNDHMVWCCEYDNCKNSRV